MPTNQKYQEKELLFRIQKGDENAFATFFYITSPNLLKTVIRLVKVEETARDLIQEVYIKAWLQREQLAEREYPIAWLKKLAS